MVYLPKFAAEVPSEDELRQILEQARFTREKREDEAYSARQKGKVERELKDPRKKRDFMTEPDVSGHTSEQERAIQEFMAQQETGGAELGEKSEIAPEKSESGLEGLMSDPKLVQQEPPGGWRCMNEGHEDRPAALKIKHNDILGEDVGDLYFCEDCAYRFKFIPIGGKTEKIRKHVMGKDTAYTISKLSSLANKLDAKGFYDEAARLDNLIRKTKGAK